MVFLRYWSGQEVGNGACPSVELSQARCAGSECQGDCAQYPARKRQSGRSAWASSNARASFVAAGTSLRNLEMRGRGAQ